MNNSYNEVSPRFDLEMKPYTKKPWTNDEDDSLIRIVEKQGPFDWETISKHMNGRSAKQCRERWSNNLDNKLCKGKWTKEEDEIIIKVHKAIGNQWSKISSMLSESRANIDVKNRFYKLQRDRNKLEQLVQSTPYNDVVNSDKFSLKNPLESEHESIPSEDNNSSPRTYVTTLAKSFHRSDSNTTQPTPSSTSSDLLRVPILISSNKTNSKRKIDSVHTEIPLLPLTSRSSSSAAADVDSMKPPHRYPNYPNYSTAGPNNSFTGVRMYNTYIPPPNNMPCNISHQGYMLSPRNSYDNIPYPYPLHNPPVATNMISPRNPYEQSMSHNIPYNMISPRNPYEQSLSHNMPYNMISPRNPYEQSMSHNMPYNMISPRNPYEHSASYAHPYANYNQAHLHNLNLEKPTFHEQNHKHSKKRK